ncbi:MAG: bifunctional riboflavin kinase/FAD synthetase [Rubrobacteraceae bacterium]
MRGVVVALGNFDGVHLGHQAVLRRAVEVAKERGSRVVAATFDPHPQAVLRPGSEPPLLTTLGLRREALLRNGADEMRVIRFDKELSRKSPEEFIQDVLLKNLGAATVVVGENFRFGYKASGGFEDLRCHMREAGGEAYAVPLEVSGGDEDINSTRIRGLLAAGEVTDAGRLLGRSYVLRGGVVSGERRGRQLGFPTANVLPEPGIVVPARGVYAGYVDVRGERYIACTNVGLAPTFERSESKVEAHLLDFEGDLYGLVVDVGFVEKVRDEKKFSGIEELRGQISRDVEVAREVMRELLYRSW